MSDPGHRPSSGAQRGRPRRLDISAAADTAMRIFWARGYDNVTTAELSDAFGVKPPSVYAAFGSKAGIFAAALDRYDTAISPAFAAMTSASDIRSVIDIVLLGAAELYTADERRRGCLALDGARGSSDPEATAIATRHSEAFRSILRTTLAALGDLKADPRADAVVTAMRGLSASARNGSDRSELRIAARAFADGIAAM